jgi:hypothetical protein
MIKYLVEFDFKYNIYLAKEVPHVFSVGVRAWYCVIEADSFMGMIKVIKNDLELIKTQMQKLRELENKEIN